MLWYKSLDNITWADIEALVSENIEESQHLDFKREIPDAKHASRRDFLRGVCAFANSGGGPRHGSPPPGASLRVTQVTGRP